MHQNSAYSDARIVALAKSGDPNAVQEAAAIAINRYFSDLYAFVRSRLTAEDAVIEDVLQEVALAVVKGIPRVRQGPHLRAWLLQIANHKVADYVRRAARERRRIDGVAAVTEHLADDRASPERLLERADREQIAAYVRRTVDRLRPRHRKALSLVYFEGVPLQDAAALMGLRSDALAALLYRARKAFVRLVEADQKREPDGANAPLLTEAVRKC